MTPSEQYNTAMYLLARCDDGINTTMLEKAIKELEQLIKTRENIPF